MKNKILSILLSVVLAVGLWAYVITVVDPEYTRTYKVKVDPAQFQYYSVMEERNLLIKERDEYVTVKLKGNRSVLVDISGEDLTLQASLANVTKPGEYHLEYTVNVPGAILVEEQNPATIYIRVEDEITKDLEIKTSENIVGEVPQGFAADKDNIFPDMEDNTITIVGPSSVVNKIDHARLDGVIDLTEKTEDIIGEYELVLCGSDGKPADAEGITIQGSKKVSVRIRIEMYKDIRLEVTIKEGGGLTKEDVTLEHETIRVSGPKALIEELGDTLVLGELDLTTLQVNQEIEPFKIDLKDDRLVNRSGIETVAVTVDFGDLQQKTMFIRKFDIKHPGDMTATVDAVVLKITVRGTAAQMAAITEADLTVVLDYSTAEAGTGVLRKPQMTVNSSAFRDVVMVAADEVSATVN